MAEQAEPIPQAAPPVESAKVYPVADAGELIRLSAQAGLSPCLILDPACRRDAVATLFQLEPSATHTPIFLHTPLKDSRQVSPWLSGLPADSPLLDWLLRENPPGWGVLLFSAAPAEQVLEHIRSLVIARTDTGREVVFRAWDGRILARIVMSLDAERPLLLGPAERALLFSDPPGWLAVDNDADAAGAWRARPAPWYAFTDAHAALFADKTLDILAANIADSLYAESPDDALPLPADETLTTFTRRQVAQAWDRGLRNPETLTNFVLCGLYLGEDFVNAPESAAWRASRDEADINRKLNGLWVSKSHASFPQPAQG